MTEQIKVTALPGNALVRFEPYWDKVTGMIVVPEAILKRRKTTGIILSIATTRRAPISKAVEEAALAGKRVLVKPWIGATIYDIDGFGEFSVVKIEDIEAIVGEDSGVELSDGAVPRCKHCGPAKSSESTNAMIMQDSAQGYYCPRCMRGFNGEIVDPDKATVSSGEVAEVKDKMARALEDEQRAKGIEPERKIISTP
jgi:co-chaperonin GroES (HSP10)